jgi:hypothetical protein
MYTVLLRPAFVFTMTATRPSLHAAGILHRTRPALNE